MTDVSTTCAVVIFRVKSLLLLHVQDILLDQALLLTTLGEHVINHINWPKADQCISSSDHRNSCVVPVPSSFIFLVSRVSNKDWKLQKVAVVRNNSAAVLTTFKINCMAGRFVLGEKKWSNGVSVASLLMHYRFSSFYLNVHSCQCIILKYRRANYLPFSNL